MTAPALTAPAGPPLPVAVSPKPVAVLPTPLAPAPPHTRKKADGETKADKGTAPLTITLTAKNGGRHVKVGTEVTLTAFTTLAHGQSATLTLFYRLNRGRETVLAFVQGSLCSTTWMAAAPGLYQFTAFALGSRRQAAVSRSVEITVDRPVTPTTPRIAVAPPPPAVSRPAQPRTPRTAKHLAAARSVRPLVYHIVAARFAFSRNAVVLAEALRKSGYHAAVRHMADDRGQTIYVVETGAYRQPGEVFEAVAGLLRSGYPAYFFTSR